MQLRVWLCQFGARREPIPGGSGSAPASHGPELTKPTTPLQRNFRTEPLTLLWLNRNTLVNEVQSALFFNALLNKTTLQLQPFY